MFQLVLLLSALGQGPAQTESRIMAAVGDISIERGSAGITAELGTRIQSGDRIATAMAGGAIWYHSGGAVVYLGPGSSVQVDFDETLITVTLLGGETRVVGNGERELNIRWIPRESDQLRGIIIGGPVTEVAELQRGIVWMQRHRSDVRIWCEKGQTTVRTAGPSTAMRLRAQTVRTVAAQEDSQSMQLAAGSELSVSFAGAFRGPIPATGSGWNIEPLRLRLMGAASLSRARKENRSIDGEEQPDSDLPDADQPDDTPDVLSSQVAATGGLALALGMPSNSTSFGASGAMFSDAQQDSVNLSFPGNIHLVTAQTSYVLSDATLTAADNFPAAREFWSIGVGAVPTGQVRTDLITGTDLTPNVIRIPGFDAYLVQLDQYGVLDPVTSTSATAQFGITGFLGASPPSPSIQGAMPLADERAQINDRVTFALGEFAVDVSGDNPQFDVRRSDQDRQIIKDPQRNDDNDQVTPNQDVTFTNKQDFKFFANVPAPGVRIPTSFSHAPALRNMNAAQQNDAIRRAALTTLMADRLHDFAQRTGQTRFVVDGQIVDITGYRR